MSLITAIRNKLSPTKVDPRNPQPSSTPLAAVPTSIPPSAGHPSVSASSMSMSTSAHNSYAGYGADNEFYGVSEAALDVVAAGSCTTDEYVEHWKRRCQVWRGEAERLQLKLDSKARATGRSGLGKNKQTMWLTDRANHSNKMSLHECTRNSIWPHNKFLHFNGRWTEYNPNVNAQPHKFAAHIMNHVQMPPVMIGFESEYYSQFVLPTVSAKLSNLRANFVTKCGNAFKGE